MNGRRALARMLLAALLPMTAATAAAAQGANVEQQIDEAVVRLVPESARRDFTRCKLRSALWGGYDAKVQVTEGTDGRAWLFEVKRGAFRYGVDPSPDPSAPARVSRTGFIQPASAREAFSRGLPFFLQDAAYDAADPATLRLTVVSNQAQTENDAMVLALIEETQQSVDLLTQATEVASKPEPQTITLKHEAFARARSVRVAILRGSDRRALVVGCQISNELDLGPQVQ